MNLEERVKELEETMKNIEKELFHLDTFDDILNDKIHENAEKIEKIKTFLVLP